MEWIMNWWWVTVLGPVVLGAAIAYALFNRRRLSPTEKARQARAVDRLYESSPRTTTGK